MKIIKNYLDKNTFNNINNIITQSNFPWYFTSYISYPNDNAGFMFNHIFYNENGITSNYFNDIIFPLLTKIKFNRLLPAFSACPAPTGPAWKLLLLMRPNKGNSCA